MSPSTILLSILFGNAATAAALSTRGEAGEAAYAQTKKVVYKDQHQFERALGSGDGMSFDDDFWSYDQGSMDTYWADYAIVPMKCMIL